MVNRTMQGPVRDRCAARHPFSRDGATMGTRTVSRKRCLLLPGRRISRRVLLRSKRENIGRVPNEMNDQISSIRLFGRAEVIVFGDDRFRGGWARFDHNIRDLRDERWNDRISSLRVELPAGGDSAVPVRRSRPAR